MTHITSKVGRNTSFILYLRILFVALLTHAKKMPNAVFIAQKKLLKRCLCLNNFSRYAFLNE